MKILLLLLILFQLNKSNQLPYYKYAIMNEEINNFTTYIYDQCSVIENECPTSSNQDMICNTLYWNFFPVISIHFNNVKNKKRRNNIY